MERKRIGKKRKEKKRGCWRKRDLREKERSERKRHFMRGRESVPEKVSDRNREREKEGGRGCREIDKDKR